MIMSHPKRIINLVINVAFHTIAPMKSHTPSFSISLSHTHTHKYTPLFLQVSLTLIWPLSLTHTHTHTHSHRNKSNVKKRKTIYLNVQSAIILTSPYQESFFVYLFDSIQRETKKRLKIK